MSGTISGRFVFANKKRRPQNIDMQKLTRWLKKANISQAALARAVGVERETVRLWLAGTRIPQLRHAFAIEDLTSGAVSARDFLRD